MKKETNELKQHKNVWAIIKEKIVRNIICSLISLGGIITIIVDISKDFLPETIKTIITFITALISFFTVVAPMIEYFVINVRDNYSYSTIKSILDAYGIEIVNRYQYSDNDITATTCKKDLLNVVSNSMRKGASRQIDSDEKLCTDYYVYTLSAAHVEDKLSIMAKYMGIIVDKIKNIEDSKKTKEILKIYVLIVPYGRNVLLGEAISNLKNIPVLISQLGKSELDSQIAQEKDPYEILYSQFIGMDSLESYLDKIGTYNDPTIKKVEIVGIVVDCNTTKGSALCKIVKYFNDGLLKNNRSSICNKLKGRLLNGWEVDFLDLKYCATLFIASQKAIPDCKTQFENNNCNLFYYFALDECAKSLLYENRNQLASIRTESNVLKMCIEQCAFAISPTDKAYELITTIKDQVV